EIGLLIVDAEVQGDGFRTYAQVKAAGHDIPAILLSTASDEGAVVQALRAGFLDFVYKTGEYLGALQDAVLRVSERLRMEAQVMESKARLSGIVSSAMDAIILLDEELRITMFNPAAEQIFEFPAAEAM